MVWQNPMPGTGKDWRLGKQGLDEQGYSIVSLPLRRPLLWGLSPGRPLGIDLKRSESVLRRRRPRRPGCSSTVDRGQRASGVASAASVRDLGQPPDELIAMDPRQPFSFHIDEIALEHGIIDVFGALASFGRMPITVGNFLAGHR